MHEIHLRRRESKSYLPAPVIANSKKVLSSVYVGQGPLRGLESDEEKKYLAKYLGEDPNANNFGSIARDFWADLRIDVPMEGVVLNIGTHKTDSKEEVPDNLYDYIIFKWVKKHPFVAKDMQELLDTSKYQFYIHDPEVATAFANKKVSFKKKAYEEFIKIGEDEVKIDRLIRLLTDSDPATMGLKQKQNLLDQEIENNPEKFFILSTDKHLEIKSIISELVSENVVNKIGNQYYFIDEKLGDTEDEAVKYFKDKKNSGTVNILKAKLQEAKR